MTRGRKPRPTHLKVIEGNPGKRPIDAAAEPMPEGLLVDAPDWFDDSQLEIWNYAIQSAPSGLLRHIDREALTIWVVAADLHRKAAIQLRRGMTKKSAVKGIPEQSPYIAIVNRQAQIMLKAAAELGFTPSSRARFGAAGGGGRNTNPYNKFAGIGERQH
jgi:P27 family predicted phage terminase small subunit